MGFFDFLTSDFSTNQGERTVSNILSGLQQTEYSVYDNLLLPAAGGDSTQIDHVVFSRYGIFVIETKDYSGYIFGKERESRWTQVFYPSRGRKKTYPFQNPLRQNYKHIKILEEITSLPPCFFYNIIVFAGSARFKTPKPGGVLHLPELISFINSRKEKIISEEKMNDAIVSVLGKTGQFVSELQTEHINNLRKRHGKPARFSPKNQVPKGFFAVCVLLLLLLLVPWALLGIISGLMSSISSLITSIILP